MPRSTTGKWVARAAATGGGRTYRGQVPANWYAALVIIVVVGLASVVFARYEYRHVAAASTVPPTKGGAPWFAAIDFDICGTQQTPLPSNALDTTTQSFYTTGKGVIIISPKKTSDAGHNAVLGKFVSAYKGLTLTATEIKLPALSTSTTSTTAAGSKKSASTPAKTYRNGQKCPAGTKDAGKPGQVRLVYWKSAFSSKGKPSTYVGNPSTLEFTDDQLITVGFVPSGTTLPKPNGKIVTALLDLAAGVSTSTTTTTAPSSSTSSTTTTAPSSSTTTTAPTSTTTTAPGT